MEAQGPSLSMTVSAVLLLHCPEAAGGTETHKTLVTAHLLFRPPINVKRGALWPTDAGLVCPPDAPTSTTTTPTSFIHPSIEGVGVGGGWGLGRGRRG